MGQATPLDNLDFTVELYDRSGAPKLWASSLTVRAENWSARAVGGCDQARIVLEGPELDLWDALRLLRHEVRIRTQAGRLVWWGYVHAINVTVNGTTVGLTLESMYNAVRVLYTYDDADGAAQDNETAEITVANSIAWYGRKELLHSAGDTTHDGASTLAWRLLNAQAWPTLSSTSGAGGNTDRAVLECRGWWHTLAWEYYEDATGREVFDEGTAEQTVGWQLSSAEVAFCRGDKTIHNNSAAFRALQKGDKVTITGSASNDATYTIEEECDGSKQLTYTAATISFGATDDINDSASGLGFLSLNDYIKVSGSVNNNGHYRLDEIGAAHVAIQKWWGDEITGEASGPSVTIDRYLKIRVAEDVINEYPGATVTASVPGLKVAQKWTPTETGTWDAKWINIRLRKEGTPADDVKVELCADSAGAPGTVLASATLGGSTIGTKMAWKEFALTATASVSSGTNYWIVVSRTGAYSATHYYAVDVDEDLGYAGGVLKLYTGSAWIDRATQADMAFQVWGTRENATQIAAMFTSTQFVRRADVVTTGVSTRHYRDGRQSALDELTPLLDMGNSASTPLLAEVTPDRTFRVWVQTDANEVSDLLLDGGLFYQADGTLCEGGWLPAGKWARIRALPRVDSFSKINPVFVDRCEFDAAAGRWTWEPRSLPDVAYLWGLTQT